MCEAEILCYLDRLSLARFSFVLFFFFFGKKDGKDLLLNKFRNYTVRDH